MFEESRKDILCDTQVSKPAIEKGRSPAIAGASARLRMNRAFNIDYRGAPVDSPGTAAGIPDPEFKENKRRSENDENRGSGTSLFTDYERPRCKILMRLPFGFFFARRIRIPSEPGVSSNPIIKVAH